MLEQGADIQYRDKYSLDSTLLHDAVTFFPASATDFLLTQDLDVNALDDFDKNALHNLLSYRANNLETDETEILALTEKLVDAGIDASATSSLDQTPLAIAEEQGYTTVAEYLSAL